MLRNSYLEPYKYRNRELSEFELEIINSNETHQLHLQKPLSVNEIKKIPLNKFFGFVDNIMCNGKVNTLLYSSNANKEISSYLKQNKSLLKITTKNGENANANYFVHLSKKKNKKKTSRGGFKPIKDRFTIINNIKNNIFDYKNKRDISIKEMKIKNNKFISSQPKINDKLEKLFYKPINLIRLNGYKNALDKCISNSMRKKNFSLPDIEFQINNVYSRLFYNAILPAKKIKSYDSDDDEDNNSNDNMENNDRENVGINKYNHQNNKDNEINILKQSLENNNNYNSLSTIKLRLIEDKNKDNYNNDIIINDYNKKINIKPIIKKRNKKTTKKRKIFSEEKIEDKNDYLYDYKKIQKFNLRKILNNINGKEFSTRITPQIKHQYWETISGGPKNQNKIIYRQNNNNFEQDYYLFKTYSSSNAIKKNEKEREKIVYNTLLADNSDFGSQLIKIKNYRDVDFNTCLHIAIINNSVKLTKYFLNKNIDLNAKNKKGDTPLHLAMKSGNSDIIGLLIDKGASLSIKNLEGKTPFDLASNEIKENFQLEHKLQLENVIKYM